MCALPLWWTGLLPAHNGRKLYFAFVIKKNSMASTSNNLYGETLGTCTLERQIGRGGMGTVYLARQLRPRRSVAVKVLQPGTALNEKAQSDFLTRFRREADAIAALDHINIMPVYEYGEQDQLAYLVMPYVSGGTLRQVLNKRGTLPLSDALPIIEQTAAALDYAHERSIVHRDIKPGNILFHADGRLLLADFGLAKVLSETTQMMAVVPPEETTEKTALLVEDDDTLSSSSLSESALIGTPEYLSPEQALGQAIDGRTDVYSLGIVLFQMLTGEVPFVGSTPLATILLHTQAEPPSISAAVPTISPEVEAVIMRAMAKDPAQRYATAGDFARALRIAMEGDEAEQIFGPFLSRKTPVLSSQSPLNNDTLPDIAQVMAAEQTTAQESPLPSAEVATTPRLLPQPGKPGVGRSRLLVAFCSLLILVLISGGAFAYLNRSLAGSRPVQAHITKTPQPTSKPTVQAAVPTPMIAAGSNIYWSPLLYSTCNQANGSWTKDSNAIVTCSPAATELTNKLTSGQRILAGMFLSTLPGGGSPPGDYLLQVVAVPKPGSQGQFGVFFRNQTVPATGQSVLHHGTYAFLIDPTDHTWNATAYNDATGALTVLTSNPVTVPLTGPLTIDILVKGNTFSLYLNGQHQGGAIDSTYASGTIGFAVSTNTDVLFQNLAIYQTAP